jgi:hypothetical protein
MPHEYAQIKELDIFLFFVKFIIRKGKAQRFAFFQNPPLLIKAGRLLSLAVLPISQNDDVPKEASVRKKKGDVSHAKYQKGHSGCLFSDDDLGDYVWGEKPVLAPSKVGSPQKDPGNIREVQTILI